MNRTIIAVTSMLLTVGFFFCGILAIAGGPNGSLFAACGVVLGFGAAAFALLARS